MAYIDAILHIGSVAALKAHLAATAPERLDAAGQIIGFAATPMACREDTALCYLRLSADEASRWQATPGVTVLASAAYGPGVADQLFGAILADPAARSLYDAVWPVNGSDGGSAGQGDAPGGMVERFGVLI